MNDETLNEKLSEARARIDELPEPQRSHLMEMLEETRDRHHQLKKDFARLGHAVSDWQMMLKYLIFDHEATRRERDDLRRRLGEQSGE